MILGPTCPADQFFRDTSSQISTADIVLLCTCHRSPSLDTTRLPGLPFPPSPCPSPHTTSQTPCHSPSTHNHSSHHTLPSPPITSLSGRCSSLSTKCKSSPRVSGTSLGLLSHTYPALMSPVLPRTLTTPRRHMLTPPTPDDLVTSRSTSQSASRSRHPLPPEATHLLTWFSSLTASMQSYGGHIIDDVMVISFFYLGWQRLEVVQMVVTNLDPCELYFFAALLMVSPQSCKPDRILSCPAARAWKMFSRREYLLARLVSPYPLFLFLLSLFSPVSAVQRLCVVSAGGSGSAPSVICPSQRPAQELH